MEALIRNVRYAVRVLGRAPAFTVTVVLTLALGIGANSAVFSAIDAVLLKPLPYPDAGRLVSISETREDEPTFNIAPVRLEEWNELSSTFEAMTGYYTEDISETSGDLPERVRAAHVAPRFLEVWGVAPALGRGFTAADHEEGAPYVVLISHRYWQRRFGGDPNVLQRQIRVDDEAYPIVGVMPESFRFLEHDVDIWVNVVHYPWALRRGNAWYSGIGRLAPGVSLEQANADLALVQAQLAEQYPDTDREVGVEIVPLKDAAVGSVRASLWLLFGAVSVLLLIACTNIAALLLSRAARRRQEVSVRLSLGASRWAVSSQIFVETAILTVCGAVVGLVIAATASAAFRGLASDLPLVDDIALDGRIVLYTVATVVIVTLLCGLLPAVRSSREDIGGTLADVRRTQVSMRHSVQWFFVGVQVALSVMLLAGAGLLIRSVQELSRVEPGFDPSRLLTFRISGSYGEDFDSMIPRFENILEELNALPVIEAAATSSPVPGVLDDGSGYQFGLFEYELVEGLVDRQLPMVSRFRVVSPSYFETMEIPLLAGERCRRQPFDSTPDVMVNRIFATRYLPGLSPVGLHLKNRSREVVSRIVGVVGDAREYGLSREPAPTVYWCGTAIAYPPLSFIVRTRGEPMAVAPIVRSKIKELEPLRSVYDIVPLSDRVGDEYAQDRIRTVLLALFAGTALSLACVGVYGTLSYVISLRRREVGLRVALGAMQGNIVSQFLLKALRVVGLACLVGLALSFAFGRGLSGMLYGVSTSDPTTLVGVIVIVTAVAALAALLPAMRAARVDPMQVLREE